TPSSRANTRTDGDAWAALNACASAIGAACCGGGTDGGSRAGDGREGASVAAGRGAGCAVDGAGAGAPACVSNTRMMLPSLTLSPTLSLRSLTTPADGDGTSIVALSDSSVTSGSSGLTVSPVLTNTSMTGTSLKSPMSGTLTSCMPPLFVAGGGDGGVGAGAGLALAGCGAPAPAPSVSSVRITPPSLTLSPTRSLRSLT